MIRYYNKRKHFLFERFPATKMLEKSVIANDIKGFAAIKNYLSLEDVSISNIQTPTNLNFDKLISNNISHLPFVKSLCCRYIYNNSYKMPSSIFEMSKLEILSYNNSKIKNITGIEKMVNLKELFLHDNKINDIKPLRYLTNLKQLNLSNNKVNDYSPLYWLQDLEILLLWCDSTNISKQKINAIKALERNLPNCKIYY